MKDISKIKRLVLKVGSVLVVDAEKAAPKTEWMRSLAEDIVLLKKNGTEVVLVSSGAVALGCGQLKINRKNAKLEEKQAAAAVGQIALSRAWQECFAEHGITVAQILLTIEDSEDRRRYLNAKNTLDTLLAKQVIPVINENDTVATTEIRVGDNDRLAARVAQMVGADALVLFSDIDGLYTADPHKDKTAKHIDEVSAITMEIRAMAGGSGKVDGTGGMITKIDAAEIAVAAGCSTAITKGESLHPLKNLREGAKATWFIASTTPRNARKHWIAGSLAPLGEMQVDEGAENALKKGNSLLAAGVKKLSGSFERGDAVLIKSASGKVLAKGLSAYSSADAALIIGHNSRDIEAILGYKGRDELVHRDDLVML